MLKRLSKLLLPSGVYNQIKNKRESKKIEKNFQQAYAYDLERYFKYSESNKIKSDKNLIGLIVRRYHAIEKGLTMANTRFGFGKSVLLNLIDDCIKYVNQFGLDEEQLAQAFAVVIEYKEFHESNSFHLEDEILQAISKIENLKDKVVKIDTCPQKEFTLDSYFKDTEASFPEFARSRSSIRHYSDQEVSMESILGALELAKTAPSACNRQSWRTHLFTDHDLIVKILEAQGGNRGFGHLANKLIVITCEVGVFGGVAERNQAFVDGGIYAMNLLYSLHYQKIGACILNCSTTLAKDKKIRELCNIKDSEVLIAMVSCGIPPAVFKGAASIRYQLKQTNRIIEK